METDPKDLEQRVAELEASLQNAFEWIATLGKQDATLLQVSAWQISKLAGGKITPPPGFTDETYIAEAGRIVENAVTLNDFLVKIDADRALSKGEKDE